MAKKKINTYVVVVACYNCDWQGEILLTKGTPANGVHECPNCECITARKKPAQGTQVATGHVRGQFVDLLNSISAVKQSADKL